MSFPKYPAYKDSGAAWLGSVPVDWRVAPLKAIARVINGHPFDAKLFNPADGFPLVRIRDLNQSVPDTRYKGEFVDAASINSKDVLIGMDGDFNVGRWLGEVPALLNQRMCCVRADTPMLTRYLEYVLPKPLKAINDVTYATTVKHLSSFDVLKISVAIPPSDAGVDEIVAFLDRETAKIDALVEEQKRLIELLKEKRQAVISQAVTKGLDPNVPMKDSGVPWLGAIPAHWRVERGRFLFGQADDPPEDGDGVVTAFRDGQVTLRENRRTDGFTVAVMEVGYQHVRAGDLVIHGMDAFAGAIGVSESDGKCTPEYSVLRPRMAGLSNHYYAASLRLMALRNYVYVICPSVRERAPRFRYESFKDVWLPVPPASEQAEIMEHVDAEVRRLSELAQEAGMLISLATERRSALISAAVTGKIDVRGLAPQPEGTTA